MHSYGLYFLLSNRSKVNTRRSRKRFTAQRGTRTRVLFEFGGGRKKRMGENSFVLSYRLVQSCRRVSACCSVDEARGAETSVVS